MLPPPVVGAEHEIAEGAGDSDVEPDGEDPAGKFFVPGEVVGSAADEGEEDERETDGSESDMGDEESQVDSAGGASATKFGGLVCGVVNDVEDEETCGQDHGGGYSTTVGADFPSFDKNEGSDEGEGGEGVHRGIDGGEESGANAVREVDVDALHGRDEHDNDRGEPPRYFFEPGRK